MEPKYYALCLKENYVYFDIMLTWPYYEYSTIDMVVKVALRWGLMVLKNIFPPIYTKGDANSCE